MENELQVVASPLRRTLFHSPMNNKSLEGGFRSKLCKDTEMVPVIEESQIKESGQIINQLPALSKRSYQEENSDLPDDEGTVNEDISTEINIRQFTAH